MTKLDKPLRREVEIAAQVYTLIIDRQGLKLKRKGRRRGLDLRWTELTGQIDEMPKPPFAPIN